MNYKSLGVGLLLVLVSPAATFAQSSTMVPVVYRCQAPSANVWYGMWDGGVGNVTTLQNFLATQGHFSATARGYFGPLTLGAVKQFQGTHNVPTTGYVGPLTRAAIGVVCGTSSAAPIIRAITPTTGAIGSTVEITGFGFSANNTILMDGMVAVRNAPITSSIAVACTTDPSCVSGIRQTITFTVPDYLSPNCPAGSFCAMYVQTVSPKTYLLSVQNEKGTSNTMSFTVGPTSSGALSISGVDAPTSLTIGQSGTWTVRVTTSQSSSLHYSVVWGDEGAAQSNIMAPPSTPVQSTATFTHTYQISGTYTPVFTVTDDQGHSTSVSASISVAPIY